MARVVQVGSGQLVDARPWRIKQGAGAVRIGNTSHSIDGAGSIDPDQIITTPVSIGMTDAGIELNPNIEVAILTSDQMYNAHTAIETAWAYQATFSIDQFDLWNYALALSYDQDTVESNSSVLELSGNEPSPLRGFQLVSEGARNLATSSAPTEYWEFYKAKVVPNGSFTVGRTVKRTLPVMVHGLANSSDVVGRIWTTNAFTSAPAYE